MSKELASLFFSARRGGMDNLRCSGRGRCDCICICDQPDDPFLEVYGDACECDNFRCPRTGGPGKTEVCSGPGKITLYIYIITYCTRCSLSQCSQSHSFCLGVVQLAFPCSERGLCCDGHCTCRNSSRGNPYRGDGLVNNCQCEPLEEVCIDPQVSLYACMH